MSTGDVTRTRTRKAEQAAETRSLLVGAARQLFGERGYTGTSIDEIALRVGVTTGAVYHHFPGKPALFRAVYEEVERELGEKIRAGLRSRAASGQNAWDEVRAGAQEFLDACLDPDIRRIALLEAPSVLGWDARRDIARYGLGLIRQGLQRSIDQRLIEPQPIEPLAHLLRSVISEGALMLARGEDKAAARGQIGAAVDRMIDGLRRR